MEENTSPYDGKQWGDTTVSGGGRTEPIWWTQIRVSYSSYYSLNPSGMREVETTPSAVSGCSSVGRAPDF